MAKKAERKTESKTDGTADGGSRARMVEGASTLLARHGLQATSFSEVLALSGAPRGSVYHHFPDGKDQMISAAIAHPGDFLLGLLDKKAGAPAPEIAAYFVHIWRSVLSRSQFESGCAVLAVTVATDSGALLDQTAAVFRGWRGRLAELLAQGGLKPRDATRLAAALVAACEGAVVLGRAERSMESFDLVAEVLLEQVRRMAKAP